MMLPDFSRAIVKSAPFANFRSTEVISENAASAMLDWLDEAPWRLRVEDFYEQHEFSLLDRPPPGELAVLASQEFVSAIARELADRLRAPTLGLVDVTVHRLVPGQTIRIHNDEIGGEETHRLLIQLNRGWSLDQGGLLMLFADDDASSVTDVIVPDHRSAFGFEISARSHHAVSTIRSGNRDTIVYTFRAAT